MKSWLRKIDREIYMYINDRYESEKVNKLMLLITFLGGVTASVCIPIILYVMKQEELFVKTTFGLVVTTVIVQSVKLLYKRTRPYEKVEGSKRIGCKLNTYSFPSGHTSTSVMLMGILAFNTNYMLAIAFISLSLLVAISRIYLGVHYPIDVLAGLVVGTSVAIYTNLGEGVILWEKALVQILNLVQLSI